ncbi:CDP-diacylglycerol--glycerol-3-phosphate 3-phosphatidyltransferase [Coxiella burnetii]|uniref:CDP-diacylglycerol--glycerol-3-phosphate 3-phosphatidyltransferase n=1 Tax=Coxiella burnetii (strain Dugway 5J108-111) TaxID=434922 RepID=A9KG47_COXBN|nr:CDP-diacylglycerol--glycerol-3-phosphate 3-phosphatidyltransferase [Coxiella burnetii]ABS76867.2 CDP-diacylglycerol--glycerol-3-phosphate 3-phosphatidyltransferase [Coxiella burnetii Dugway 5J108-111]OYK80172.1 CDP-diacylglycerol--glycerol-3-phosphate 3-phosphatidyltransferase [Coxiella burnetii]OYK82255.1 CDP-diacylglycerol--glycerol-3-phosphate 3-phosphatidyltransferase [Coxiella burnetii]
MLFFPRRRGKGGQLDLERNRRRIEHMNIATFLTFVRLSAIPIFGIFYFLPFRWAHPVAALIFIVAGITDWLDGYLARSLSQMTDFGAFLDPVADKLLVSAALVLVVGENYVAYLAVPAAVIICREILISALREWMAELGKRTSLAVTLLSKVKTLLQMLALILLIGYAPGFPAELLWGGVILLWIAAVLTVWTMIIYLKIAWPDLTMPREQ